MHVFGLLGQTCPTNWPLVSSTFGTSNSENLIFEFYRKVSIFGTTTGSKRCLLNDRFQGHATAAKNEEFETETTVLSIFNYKNFFDFTCCIVSTRGQTLPTNDPSLRSDRE